MRAKLLGFVVLLLSFNALTARAEPAIPSADRVRIAEAFKLSRTVDDHVWKGWSKTPFAIMLVTSDYEFLVRHPNPSSDFTSLGYDRLLESNVYYRKRTYPQGLLATFPAITGSSISTIVVGQPEKTHKTSTEWVITLFHEHFHQLQNAQPTYFAGVNALNLARGDNTGMWMLNYAFPYDKQEVQQQFSMLSKLLAEAIDAQDEKDRSAKLAAYLVARRQFQQLLDSDDYKYISFQFWQEGIARYTEYRVAKFAAAKYKPSKAFRSLKDFVPFAKVSATTYDGIMKELLTQQLGQSKRVAVYPFGAAEGLLLDRVNPAWQSRYFVDKFDLKNYYGPQAQASANNKGATPPQLPREDCVVIAEAYHLWQSLGESLWPGWTKISVSFIYVTSDYEYAINFPKKLEGFTQLDQNPWLDKPMQVRKQSFPTHASASFSYEGVDTVVIGTPKALEKSPAAWALTASHEMFHILEAARGEIEKVAQLKIGPANDPSWQLDFPFPYKDADIMRLIHLQGYQIYLAVTDNDDAAVKYDAGTAVDAIRVYRSLLQKQSPDNKSYNYSQFQQLSEGIAFYTEYKMAEAAANGDYQPTEAVRQLPDYKSYQQAWNDEYKNRLFLVKHAGRAAQSRTAFYHLGLGKGLLLDRLMPDWKARYFAPGVWLDELLITSLGQPNEIPLLTVGSLAPEFSLPTMTGESLSLSRYRGQVVLIDFWQTWCPPCIEELPHLVALQEKYRRQGLIVLGIVGKLDAEGPNQLRDLTSKYKINYPIVIDEKGSIGGEYNLSGYPHVFIVDKTGRLSYDQSGYRGESTKVDLEKEIQKALGSRE